MSTHKLLFIGTLAFCLAVACSDRQPPADSQPQEKSYVNELGSEVTRFTGSANSLIPRLLDGYGTPGASIALVEDGRLVWSAAYGSADQNGRRGMTSETVFALNDLSKPVTAWGVMHLVEEGKIGLDTPVDSYLKRWHVPASAFDAQQVTVRRLLSHTTGISPSAPNPRASSLEASLGGPAPFGPPAVQVKPAGTIHVLGSQLHDPPDARRRRHRSQVF